jgi:hypothetical protein
LSLATLLLSPSLLSSGALEWEVEDIFKEKQGPHHALCWNKVTQWL